MRTNRYVPPEIGRDGVLLAEPAPGLRVRRGHQRPQNGPQCLSCGRFAVPSAMNSREHSRTAVHEPQRFRGFSRLFPAVPGK